MKTKSIITLLMLFTFTLPTTVLAQQPRKAHHPKIEMRAKSYPQAMHRKDFKMMCEVVKDASFNEKKIGVIKVACISSYFDSKQCVKLLSMISFENDRLKALEVLAPRVLDINPSEILKQFSFSSNKDKAMEILVEQ